MSTLESSISSLGDALFSKTQQRVLERMLAAGLLVKVQRGNQSHYQANPECPIHQELVAIVRKTFGIGDVLRAALRPMRDRITQGFIYGSIA